MNKMIFGFMLSFVLTGCFELDPNNEAASSLAVSAGEDITVDERSMVALEASLGDMDEDDVSVAWSQVSGSLVDIIDGDSLTPRFRAPTIRSNESVVLRVTIRDGSKTMTDEVTISVKDKSTSPQGIDEDSGDRRDKAKSKRSGNRPMTDSREVRTYDGSNNNLENTLWGATYSHLVRWGNASYTDGISSMAGASRPSARVVSNNMSAQATGEFIPNSFGTTDFLWQWGQFLDHDIGITDGTEEAEDIVIPTGDTSFDPTGSGDVTMLFSRAFYDTETGNSTSNPREQENENTSWIDGSMIYGSDAERAAALRVSDDSPYLATSEGNLLPFNTSGQTNANAFGLDDATLFLAGDVRANEQVGLTAMHTLWVREHNRIAKALERDASGLSGEDIFQATRRLVIAKIQIITFEEYLPVLIGDNAISDYQGYDDKVNPGLYNEFSVAAYRYGHSLVNETLLRLDSAGNTIADGHLSLRNSFFTASTLFTEETSIDPIFRGMATQLSQKLDTKAINDLRNFLFGEPGAGGLDLISLNVQRGRDHGVPSYNDMRAVFGLERMARISDISSDPEVQAALLATYSSVDDIDLWIGGLAEDPLVSNGSQFGELFQKMHIVQFEAFRDGDRFWYENDLTKEEMSLVKGTTLSKVIRANTQVGSELQDNAFIISN